MMAYNSSNFSYFSNSTSLRAPVFDRSRHCLMLSKIVEKHNNMYLHRGNEKTLLITLYSIVITLGTLENLFVIMIILPNKRLRNLRNGFVVHLALSDLLLCVLTAPMTLFFSFNNFWEFGDLACKFVASLQAVNTFLSLLTLTAIAWDRYLLIIFPVRWRSPKLALILILTSVWVISLLVAAPYFFAVGTMEYFYGIWKMPVMEMYLIKCNAQRPHICVELFRRSGFFSKKTFTIIIFISQYVFPLSGLLYVYGNIVRHTLSRRKRSLGQCSRVQQIRRRQRKTILLLTGLVLVFGICWLPSNLYCTLDALGYIKFDQFMYIYFHLFGMVTACINPVLYGLLNANVQKSMSLQFRAGRLMFRFGSPRTSGPSHSRALLDRIQNANNRWRFYSEDRSTKRTTVRRSTKRLNSTKSAANLLNKIELRPMKESNGVHK